MRCGNCRRLVISFREHTGCLFGKITFLSFLSQFPFPSLCYSLLIFLLIYSFSVGKGLSLTHPCKEPIERQVCKPNIPHFAGFYFIAVQLFFHIKAFYRIFLNKVRMQRSITLLNLRIVQHKIYCACRCKAIVEYLCTQSKTK